MKRIILMLFVVMATISAKAQVYMGGELAAWRNKNAGVNTIAIKPEVGYNFSEKWAVGTVLAYEFAKVNGAKVNGLAVAPYARYSFYENTIVSLFVDGGFGVSSEMVKHGETETGYEVGLKPGIALKLNHHFSLVAKCGFLGYRDSYMSTTDGGGVSLTSEDLSFGFHYEF